MHVQKCTPPSVLVREDINMAPPLQTYPNIWCGNERCNTESYWMNHEAISGTALPSTYIAGPRPPHRPCNSGNHLSESRIDYQQRKSLVRSSEVRSITRFTLGTEQMIRSHSHRRFSENESNSQQLCPAAIFTNIPV